MHNIEISEIKRVFDLQKQHQWEVRGTSAAARKQKPERFKQVLLAHADEVAEALSQDLRKPREEPMPHELAGVIAEVDEVLAHLDDWMKPVEVEPSPMLAGTRAVMTYEPRGVCLLFGPWNFPFLLVFEPLVPMIAAGNCAIVKPNEMAPATSALAAKLIREIFDEREVAVFEGDVALSNALLELPFDHIFFTGSPKVARTVMAAAARHLSSVTLELGGKCPAIIDETVDLQKVAAAIGEGRMMNAGQICLCPDHVWVPESLRDEFVAELAAFVRGRFYPGGELDKTAYGRIVDARNFNRLKGYLDDAMERGATLALGGELEAGDLTVHPTVLTDVPANAAVMQEEIFGPILPVMTYRDPREITDFLHRGGKPLAMYLFSDDQDFIDSVLHKTSSGGVTVNGWALHWFEQKLPFGGVNESGIGRYHGVHGFKELSHERAMVVVPGAAMTRAVAAEAEVAAD
jgi:aldehyde dehydrogenase (NAD+)